MSKSSPSPNLNESVGLIEGLIKQGRLAWRLLNDGRVPGWLKLIPFAALIYLLSPIDLIPDLALPGLGEVDDVIVIVLALKMLVDLSPPIVVSEHLEDLLGRRGKARPTEEPSSGSSYIDASYRVLEQDEDKQRRT